MIEYIYKGFKLSYTVSQVSNTAPEGPHAFEAHGNAVYLLNHPKWFTQTHLHAEDDTHAGAEHEIKRLLESYVDFELKNFYAHQQKQQEISQ